MAKGTTKEIALYRVKEIFYSLQGEGFHAGRAAVFIRFSGCNLWSGTDKDRSSAQCPFCDTDFTGTDGGFGGSYDAVGLVRTALSLWEKKERPFVVCTGGEPMLQIDDQLIKAMRAKDFVVALETNGTIPVTSAVDWITVSPKKGAALRQISGNELKLVYPQDDLSPANYEDFAFEHFYLQPVDSSRFPDSVAETVGYCLTHPKWRLSLQTHKLVGIK